MYSPKIKGLDQSGPDALSGSSRATSSRGQHVSVCSPALVLGCFGAFFLFFGNRALLEKLVFSALLGAVADTVFGVDVLVLLLVSAQGLPLLPPALTVCISVAE